jgi:hypothetical protein
VRNCSFFGDELTSRFSRWNRCKVSFFQLSPDCSKAVVKTRFLSCSGKARTHLSICFRRGQAGSGSEAPAAASMRSWLTSRKSIKDRSGFDNSPRPAGTEMQVLHGQTPRFANREAIPGRVTGNRPEVYPNVGYQCLQPTGSIIGKIWVQFGNFEPKDQMLPGFARPRAIAI